MRIKQYLIFSLVVFFLNACATFKPQYKNKDRKSTFPSSKEIAHSLYLIGDAGNFSSESKENVLQLFKDSLSVASSKSTAIFLGDNIYPKGLPSKNSAQRKLAEGQLDAQINSVSNFKGNTIFIPGNHDWYSGQKGLKRQEKYIENKLGENTFLPENGCPIKKVKINKSIDLIIIDSYWYIANWDKHPNINSDCDIITRTQFFDEFEGLIKKARGKTTLVAIHHPMFTQGPHGGQFSLKQHLTPIPVLGTLKNIVRKTSGVSPEDLIGKRYQELQKRIVTLSQENEKVIFLSGHEHSLQYIVKNNLPQIVSGSGSNKSATRLVGKGQFSYGTNGFSRLDIFTDGSSYVRFYSTSDKKTVFETTVFSEDEEKFNSIKSTTFPKTKKASIYSDDLVNKGKAHKCFWGKRYREDYGVKVSAPTINLDTLFGGLKPVKKGGGHQSKSLRLEDPEGREYVMRALKKNAVQFLQAVAFKNQNINGKYDKTVTENILLDVFAGSHPYAPFTIGKLSDAVGVYHTNPVLYYVPKQKALGVYNNEFGDELYMIEERAASGHGEQASFGNANKVISTHDMLQKINKNQNHTVDEKSYIRARLFDMLIGDWDRHEDQWRWAVFEENNKVIYRPIPRDRDQAFSIMGDGFFLSVITEIVPNLRLMKKYKDDLKSPKWFNLEPYPLDVALINQSGKEVWDKEVQHIRKNLTDQVIDVAFKSFPTEVNQETISEIKRKLIGRRNHLQEISDKYFIHVNKFSIVRGTNKDDLFEIERAPGGITKIIGYRIQKGVKGEIFHQRTYSCLSTQEIWIYGLGDTDTFEVKGKGDDLIRLYIVGGYDNDVYTIENGKEVIIYDYKSKENTFTTKKGKIKLIDDYKTNAYDYKKLKNSANQFAPLIGYNPDDGIKIGFSDTFRTYGFKRNPFSSEQKIAATFYFATQGFDIEYNGEFANIIGKVNLGIDMRLTSPNYSINFFGFGNETINPNVANNKNFSLDYNRVKLSKFIVAPSLVWRGKLASKIKGIVSFQTIEVEQTQGRFINDFNKGKNIENRDSFVGVEVDYSYENKDDKVFPTLGMETSVLIGYKNNIDTSKGFAYLKPELSFDHKLEASGRLVLATKFGSHINFGNNFEFYQGANLGANNGLRGYRNQRFTGKHSYYQSTDLRMILGNFKTGVLPLSIGVYGGLDYGRVWLSNDTSKKWNNSYGGGVFVNASKMVVGNISLFSADENVRFSFKLGFGF